MGPIYLIVASRVVAPCIALSEVARSVACIVMTSAVVRAIGIHVRGVQRDTA